MSRANLKLTALLIDAQGEPLPTITDPKTRRKIAIATPGTEYAIRYSAAVGRSEAVPLSHLYIQFDAGNWQCADMYAGGVSVRGPPSSCFSSLYLLRSKPSCGVCRGTGRQRAVERAGQSASVSVSVQFAGP